jgi:2-C-methyl-D-erythritol 4-phosphate cytidylyltransferase
MAVSKKEYALIVAGGKGTRIPGQIPKQFIELAGKPVLLHTVEAFIRYSPDIPIILVLPESDFDRWRNITGKFNLTGKITLQAGGATRFQSVRNGLACIEEEGFVAIHDGVRPLVSEEIISASFRLAAIHLCAVAAVRLKESIRETDRDSTRAVDRSRFRVIQTPQTFDVKLIKQAYRMQEDPSLTDDASVAEHAGHTISLFEGNFENIKITTAEDLIVAEALLKQKS